MTSVFPIIAGLVLAVIVLASWVVPPGVVLIGVSALILVL